MVGLGCRQGFCRFCRFEFGDCRQDSTSESPPAKLTGPAWISGDPAEVAPTKPTKPGFDGFVGAPPRQWAESVSGHHALSSHVDACFGLERQRDDDGEESIAFGGIARNTEPRTILLEDNEDTLRFEVRQGEAVLETILTPKQREIWKTAAKMKQFGFNELVTRAGATNNRKAVSSTLKKADGQGLLTRSDKGYIVKSGG
jgi:hypothetical protein